MQKFVAAVIHMEQKIDRIELLVGESIDRILEISNQQSYEVFSDDTISFLSEISVTLLKDPSVKNFPDVISFAFYIRNSNLRLMKRDYYENSIRIGRGVVFHITPGNVPVNFAFSFFAGIITGNSNVIRVPSKPFKQVELIIQAINKVLKQSRFCSLFSNRLYFVRYDSESNLTSFLSQLCDIRVIWGGDETINHIRKSIIPPKSSEITFSDRYSISIIEAQEYIKSDDKYRIASDFYNDTYLFDQNACTSPQTIYWLGANNEVSEAQHLFWELLGKFLNEKKFELQPILSVDKLTTLYSQAIAFGDIVKVDQNSNNIYRVFNKTVHNDIDLFKCGSGYFNEVNISSLDQLNPILSRKYQTISYFGIAKDDLIEWISKARPLGVDRIVPIGRTMNFSLFWDGYDLVSELSRKIQID